MSTNLYNQDGSLADNQAFFDSYNNLMFAPDAKVLFKLFMRYQLFLKVQHLNGDIVECGVFKGAGMAAWLKMLNLHAPHEIKSVIGFDHFDPLFIEKLKDKNDAVTMTQVFDRCKSLTDSEISLEGVQARLDNVLPGPARFKLEKGDISITARNFVAKNPGFRISLLYLDLDLATPTYDALVAFWPRVVPGGIVVFDEYAYHAWSESFAVERFVSEQSTKIHVHKLPTASPTAFIYKTIIKPHEPK